MGEVEKAVEADGRTVFEDPKTKVKKRKREHFGDPSDPEGYKGTVTMENLQKTSFSAFPSLYHHTMYRLIVYRAGDDMKAWALVTHMGFGHPHVVVAQHR